MEDQEEIPENEANGMKKRTPDKAREFKSSGKPWWLVVFLTLVLVFFGTYIGWLNSPQADLYKSFGAYLFEPRTTEVIPESASTPNSTFVSDVDSNSAKTLPDQDSITDSWDSEVSDQVQSEEGSISEGDFEKTDPVPSTAPAAEKTTYYIKAGEFSTPGAAQYRMRELRQGNYQPRLMEPTTEGGKYQVAVGEFDSYAKAREQSRAIDFILEIRTSVEKKE